jgi:hypothetical protein
MQFFQLSSSANKSKKRTRMKREKKTFRSEKKHEQEIELNDGVASVKKHEEEEEETRRRRRRR